MKKVLIVTYYWPPGGGVGVQRWVKFVKYLKEFGWEPIVYIPDNADYPIKDESLEKDISKDIAILKHPIWEPYAYYNRFLGANRSKKTSIGLIKDKDEKKSILKEISLWIRGNFFVPDARKFWVKPSVNYLGKYLENNAIDALITTGPPHSVHLIGLNLKKSFGIKWLADFRDPWVYMDNYIEDFKYSKRTLRKQLKLESTVLTEADKVVVVTEQMVKDYKHIRNGINLITNGFDLDDFDRPTTKADEFIIGHYGTLGEYRNPSTLLSVLKDLCAENEVFKTKFVLELIGPVDSCIFQGIDLNGLSPFLRRVKYLPHKESIKRMMGASILLLLLDKNVTMKGRMTGKIFEYLAAQRPILGQGSLESDPVKILKESDAGVMIEYDDYDGIKSFILEKFNSFIEQKPSLKDSSRIDKFSRRELTKKLVVQLDEMILSK